METFIESDINGNNLDPLMKDTDEVDSPLKGMEESSKSITFDSSWEDAKESSNFLGVEDGKIGLGSIPLLKLFKGWRLKLWKSLLSIEE